MSIDAALYVATGFLLGCAFMWWMAYLATGDWKRPKS
jgi:hypothetical protein